MNINKLFLLLAISLISSCALYGPKEEEIPRIGQPFQTTEDRVLEYKLDVSTFKKYSKGSIDTEWLTQRRTTLANQERAITCEKFFLEDYPNKNVEEVCKNYDSPAFEPGYKTGSMDVIASTITRIYYTSFLFKNKRYKEGEAELTSLDYFYNTVKTWGDPSMPQIKWAPNVAVQQLRIDLISKFIQILTVNGRMDEAKNWTTKRDQYVTDLSTLLAEYKYEDEVYSSRHDTNRRNTEFEYDAALDAKWNEIDRKKQEADREKAREEANNPAKAFYYDVYAGDGGSSNSGGACTCSVTEPVWKSDYSAQGQVKGRRGHYEFKQKQVSCPCR